ncbi:hypothetical protein ACTFIW_000831 [Dictyostelium discoideum]
MEVIKNLLSMVEQGTIYNGLTCQTRFYVKSRKEGSRNKLNYVSKIFQSITFLGLQIDSESMKLLVPIEKKKRVIKEIRNFLKLDCCSPRKLASLKRKLIALKDAVIPFRLFKTRLLLPKNILADLKGKLISQINAVILYRLYTRRTNNYNYVLTTDASESGTGATLKKGNKIIKPWSFQWSTTQSNMSSNRREMVVLLMAYQALWWSDTGPISFVEQLWKQCLEKKVNLIGEHIPGFFNVKADHI